MVDPVYILAKNGYVDVCKVLLENNVNIDKHEKWCSATTPGHKEWSS